MKGWGECGRVGRVWKGGVSVVAMSLVVAQQNRRKLEVVTNVDDKQNMSQ